MQANVRRPVAALLFLLLVFLILLAPISAFAGPVQEVPEKAPTAAWCGALGEYTTWYGIKPVLYVWKGKGNGNPYNVKVYYNNALVPNADHGVIVTSPQVDRGDGWVGYFIAKRFVSTNWQWDDDWRWDVRGCIP